MKIPFTLEAWLKDKSQKVETRDGRPSRILCWDRRGERSLVVLVQQPLGYDDVLYYYESGLADGIGRESDEDLFLITPEPEMSEFEKAVDAIYESCWVKELQVKKKATKLLALAREELFANDAVLKEYAEVAREQGKAEALKDLPRWDSNLKSSMVDEADVIGQWLYYKEHRIRISDLEKLPGFKEDESHE